MEMSMENKKKLIILSSIIIGVLVAVLGFTYALFTFDRAGTNQELVLGDIWMKYEETNGISLEDALPGAAYSKYFEFTITGKNTYTEKDIWYDVRLTKGDIPEGKTEDNRIEDKYLKFKLVEVNGEVETEILTDKTYDDLTNQTIHVATIPKATNSYSKTYRLYMVISEELLIGNVEGAISSSEFETLFGSIKVATTGDFTEKEVPPEPINWFDEIVINNNSESCPTYIREDGITYLSGTKDCIDFNYVWYSGKLWRITAINSDGTMKMITDSNITSINWGASSTVSSEDLTSAYSTSYMREWLNQEFLPTLYNYENIIVEDAGWYSITDSADPPTKSTGDYTLTDPVGLLNAYEYYMSYKNTSNSSGYLNIGYYWYLITPYDSSYLRAVGSDGDLRYHYILSLESRGVRPSINLTSTIEFNGGSGTIDDPYKIKGDNEEVESNTTLLNTRQSGEYVKLSSDETAPIFRIVDTELVGENLTTKIVLNDYIKESDTVLTKYFSSSKSNELWSEVDSSDTTYWRGYLNTTWLGTLDTSMLEKGTYYLGYHSTGSYKTTVCSTVSSDISINECIENGTVVSNISRDDYVGLLRAGEMFASQTSDYTYSTAIDMWLITPYNSLNVQYVSSIGRLNYHNPSSYGYGVRPSINLKSTILIKSGSGTKQDPFVVSLS